MNTGRTGCGSGKGFRGWGAGNAGAYCCAPHQIAYNPASSLVKPGHAYQFPTRDAALAVCMQGGYERLCSKAEATGYEACAAGWVSTPSSARAACAPALSHPHAPPRRSTLTIKATT
jgi:hypothetical protein